MTAIVIVDDSLTVRMDLAEALEGVGFAAIACRDLAEARQALRAQPIALAILDVRLPDGDGVDFLHELRSDARTAELPVIMLSNEAEVADRVRGLKTGASDYFGKPYDTDLLISRVRELVVARPRTAELVLVVDDSETFREALSERLIAAGYEVAAASAGAEGLRMAAARRPDAVIVDGVMPDMRGERVIRRIRLDPALRATPCLLLTGSDDIDAEIAALDAGADAFARKESDVEVILVRFAAMLRGARGTRPFDAGSALGPNRILVVDDSTTYLHTIAEQLHEDGHDVVLASSGEQALELLEVQPVDCILLDMVMPGLSGVETCTRLKAAPTIRDIPLIAVSGEDNRRMTIDAIGAGADDFVSKAVPTEVLRARVKSQIRRKKLGDENRAVREQLLRSEHEAAVERAARQFAESRAALAEELAATNHELAATNRELAAANRELEAFSYSVSHDLRAPLRAIKGFGALLAEDAGPKLDEACHRHLERIQSATSRMSDLIDGLLDLARLSRVEVAHVAIDVSHAAGAAVADLRGRDPDRVVEITIAPDLRATGDPRLVRIVFDQLLSNAWKFTTTRPHPRIDVGRRDDGAFFVRDNGVGFDMAMTDRLFAPFHRLHPDVPGTGIGLATVQRIIDRHRGRVWAESAVGIGTTLFFTLPG